MKQKWKKRGAESEGRKNNNATKKGVCFGRNTEDGKDNEYRWGWW